MIKMMNDNDVELLVQLNSVNVLKVNVVILVGRKIILPCIQ